MALFTGRKKHGHRRAAGDSHDSVEITEFAPGGTTTIASLPAAAAALSRTRKGTELIERTAEVPILAYKRSFLSWKAGGEFGFAHYARDVHQREAIAGCYRPADSPWLIAQFPPRLHTDHVAPHPACRCGFYAMRDPITTSGDCVRLDVELTGRIIVAEHGYRAQQQYILRASIIGCHWCGGEPVAVALIGEPNKARPLIVCAGCSIRAHATDPIVPLETVNKRLPVPIEWDGDVGSAP